MLTRARKRVAGWSVAAMLAATPAVAQIKVGFVASLSGPVSSIGLPYQKGIAAGQAYQGEVGGSRIQVFTLDDASDPSTAARNARKLIEEEKVDLLIGSAGAPASLAIAAVSYEQKVPFICIANADLPGEPGSFMVTIPQPAPLMVSAVVERMKKGNVQTVGYIGFSDAWGDLVYNGLTRSAEPAGLKVVTNERYARPDTSVTAQVLKIIAARPDAVITGGSGTPGALPHLALAERGYRGQVYGTHALVNADFVRVGGQAVEGMIAPTGPAVVAEQLPDDYPTKKMALAFREAYQKANGQPTTDAFAAYAFDGWLVFLDAAKRVGTGAQPGTPAYRQALRDAIQSTKELVGTHAVYSFTPASRYGTDERSRVLVQLEKGSWKLVR